MSDLPTASALRLGILGAANIAKQFVRDVTGSAAITVAAVASRKQATADAFADSFGIEKRYNSYEALLADPAIDAIYIPLPNSLHAEWAIKCAEAGKHILCEKPLCLGLDEAKAMFEAARKHGVLLLEAYPYAFQPQTRTMLDLIAKDEIGEIRALHASFGFMLPPNPANIRLNPDLGGGALLDAGSYPLGLIRLVMGIAPERVRADSNWTEAGVDIATSGTLYYADGRRAEFSCAMNAANHRRATIAGTKGTIETEYLNHTADRPGDNDYGYLPSDFRLRRGVANSVPFENIHNSVGSGFRFAAEAFAAAVAKRDAGFEARTTQFSLDQAATLQALAESARRGETVTVSR